MVSDRWRDVGAGQAAGCLTFLLDAAYNRPRCCQPDFVVADLPEAARLIVRQLRSPDDGASR